MSKPIKPVTLSAGGPKSVAEYISWQIWLCGKSQKEIAELVGFQKPNIITMIKTGATKLPLDKVGKLAKAIEVDAVHLFKMCMKEYYPEALEDIEHALGQTILTQNELEIIEAVRAANVVNPRIRTEEDRARIIAVIETLKHDNATN